jgi:hypothetical protein
MFVIWQIQLLYLINVFLKLPFKEEEEEGEEEEDEGGMKEINLIGRIECVCSFCGSLRLKKRESLCLT